MTFPAPVDRTVAGQLARDGIECRFRASPHYNERMPGRPVDVLVLHYTALSLSATLAHFASPASRVSTHFVIGREGELSQHVSLEKRAWHAGASELFGEGDVNSRSIGIDLVFVPGRDGGYSGRQMEVLTALGRALLASFPIRRDGIVGHEHVAMPRGRKKDPGRWLDWQRVYRDLGLGSPPPIVTSPS
ncbi:MAG: hypothetical protein FJ109_06540 [Deltaproteobacteria bacterium]|nr:hypothetical protein [Deltaproteobacteria bacterium]